MAVSKTPEQMLTEITAFHGHGGPWAALGYRAGLLARAMLKPDGMHGISVSVSLLYERPYSCFLDGLQLTSGCTIGKKNLTFQAGSREPVSDFRAVDGKLGISIRPAVLQKITPPDDSKTLWVLGQTDTVLFIIV